VARLGKYAAPRTVPFKDAIKPGSFLGINAKFTMLGDEAVPLGMLVVWVIGAAIVADKLMGM
jgi:hypothetical protein